MVMAWDIIYLADGNALSVGSNSVGITRINFHGVPLMDCGPRDRGDSLIAEAARQLTCYFAGSLEAFTVPLDLRGTPFQRLVWQALQQIPYGRTISYKQLAAQVGSPNGFRAVGAANGRNPVPIIVPCHRVIQSGGGLGGFGGGLELKRRLLDLESGALPALFDSISQALTHPQP